MIGNKTTQAAEFTLYNRGEKILIELDGSALCYTETLELAHDKARKHARRHKLHSAGLTETFGRNRQFILSPRGSWQRHKM